MTTLSLITGTTHGIGLVTARELARAGHEVVMLCRNIHGAQQLRNTWLQEMPDAVFHVIHCDLASLSSVRSAADTVLSRFPTLDLLINNAGTISLTHHLSVDGFERVFATNHLGPFLLTELLRPRMQAGGRIINVASAAHYRGTLDLENITNPKARYRSIEAYAQSKLANIMHTFALARRTNGSGITVNCLHPGVVNSHLLPWWVRVIKPLIRRETFNNERGAKTTLVVALSEDVKQVSGQYFDEHQQVTTASSLACDINVQEQLWQASQQWVSRWL